MGKLVQLWRAWRTERVRKRREREALVRIVALLREQDEQVRDITRRLLEVEKYVTGYPDTGEE